MERQMGAINMQSGKYELPDNARKSNNYKCIGCGEKLILRQGNIRKCHFAHYSSTGCSYHDHPSESDIHKEAKNRLASWLEERIQIDVCWFCQQMRHNGNRCELYAEGGLDFAIDYTDNDRVVVEYQDKANGYIADVALLSNDEVKYIFEIKHTHATTTKVRPEPWMEIEAKEILNVERTNDDDILLTCVRKTRACKYCRIINEKWAENLPRRYKPNNMSKNQCIKCNSDSYSPVFKTDCYRQICEICLCTCEDELRNEFSNDQAKIRLASWLEKRIPIHISWVCQKPDHNDQCITIKNDMNINIKYANNDRVVVDYQDKINGYIADVAHLSNDQVKYIFKIKYAHATAATVKHEPWVEIEAREIFDVEKNKDGVILLRCVRKDRACRYCRIIDDKWVDNLPITYKQINNMWRPCIRCNHNSYSAVFKNGYRQICKWCLCKHEDELRKNFGSINAPYVRLAQKHKKTS